MGQPTNQIAGQFPPAALKGGRFDGRAEKATLQNHSYGENRRGVCRAAGGLFQGDSVRLAVWVNSDRSIPGDVRIEGRGTGKRLCCAQRGLQAPRQMRHPRRQMRQREEHP
jgi:hypothetical protein